MSGRTGPRCASRPSAPFPSQESTPAAQAEPRLSPQRAEEGPGASRQPQVLQTPLAAAGRRPLAQKRLLSAYDEAEGKAPGGKRLCPEPPRDPAAEPCSPPANGLDGTWEAESDGSEAEEQPSVSDRRDSAGAGLPAPRRFPKQCQCQCQCRAVCTWRQGSGRLSCSSQDAHSLLYKSQFESEEAFPFLPSNLSDWC